MVNILTDVLNYLKPAPNKGRKDPHRKKIAFSMRGGGVNVAGYLGALRALEEAEIKPDMIIGSSAGAIVAAAYAIGFKLDEIAKMFTDFKAKEFIGLDSLRDLSLASDDMTMEFFRKHAGNPKIEDTKIRLYIQVTNVSTYKPEIITKGELVKAVTASVSVPIIYKPIEIAGQHYIDGDLTAGYANSFLKQRGADIVIGMNTGRLGNAIESASHTSLPNRFSDLIYVAVKRVQELDQKLDPVDYVLANLGGTLNPIFDGPKSSALIEHGYKLTRKEIPGIKKLIGE